MKKLESIFTNYINKGEYSKAIDLAMHQACHCQKSKLFAIAAIDAAKKGRYQQSQFFITASLSRTTFIQDEKQKNKIFSLIAFAKLLTSQSFLTPLQAKEYSL